MRKQLSSRFALLRVNAFWMLTLCIALLAGGGSSGGLSLAQPAPSLRQVLTPHLVLQAPPLRQVLPPLLVLPRRRCVKFCRPFCFCKRRRCVKFCRPFWFCKRRRRVKFCRPVWFCRRRRRVKFCCPVWFAAAAAASSFAAPFGFAAAAAASSSAAPFGLAAAAAFGAQPPRRHKFRCCSSRRPRRRRQFFLSRGADVNSGNFNGSSPLTSGPAHAFQSLPHQTLRAIRHPLTPTSPPPPPPPPPPPISAAALNNHASGVRNMSNFLSAESGCYRIRPSRPFVNGVMQPYRLLLARRPPVGLWCCAFEISD
jgi:hypothetical protein